LTKTVKQFKIINVERNKDFRKEMKGMAITLKAARVNAGLTQIESAKKLGIAVDTLRMYETGKTFPDVPIIKKIENLYHVSYNDINFLLPTNNG
jgi:putative transcriptional regulator